MSSLLKVNVTETNDIEFRDDIYDIDVKASQDQEVSFFMRTKFRRVIQKKGINENEGYPDEYGARFENTMLSSRMSDGYNKMGGANPYDPSGLNMVGGSPYLWIKIDPYNQYLKKMVIREGEKELIAQ